MEIALTFIIGLLIGAGIVWFIRKAEKIEDPYLKEELDRRKEETGELKSQIEQLKTENTKLSENGKSTFVQLTKIESDNKALTKEKEGLSAKITKHEAEETRREKENDKKLADLEESRKGFENEKVRVARKDEEETQKKIEERDRMWNDHENNVNALLSSLCKMQEHSFEYFDNNNLPEGFDGSLKPDFFIEFLGQYVIFDSKVSKRADNIQIYINENVKKTAKKLKNNTDIYPSVFFVIPTDAISELKKTYFYEDGISFYVVSPEALAPILASLKKIRDYEIAEKMDPLQRENIVSLIADLDWHVNFRNAADIFMSKLGVDILTKARNLDPEIAQEVKTKKENMRMPNMNNSDMKKMTGSIDVQDEEIKKIENPKASITQLAINKAKTALTKKLG